MAVTTWTLRHPTPPDAGLRVAVKDLIDVVGEPTTAGSRAVERRARPAVRDAECLGGLRAAVASQRACYAGRTNLHELAYGISGINPAFGTPVNPLDPSRVPGGSSSGAAAAVAGGEVDIAIGTDTGGSIRIPAACCGVVGLKTTYGRVPTEGVRPLAPSLDTVGPIARDVAGLVAGMGLLEAGFTPTGPSTTLRVGRIRLPAGLLGTPGLPGSHLEAERVAVEAAVDAALASAGWEVVAVELPGLTRALAAAMTILDAEAWAANGHLVRSAPGDLGADVLSRLQAASRITSEALGTARSARASWVRELLALLGRPGRIAPRDLLAGPDGPDEAEGPKGAGGAGALDLLAAPTLLGFPPLLEAAPDISAIRGINAAVNLAGLPALALPIPSEGPVPASLQLIGPAGGEELLVAAGARIESVVRPSATS